MYTLAQTFLYDNYTPICYKQYHYNFYHLRGGLSKVLVEKLTSL